MEFADLRRGLLVLILGLSTSLLVGAQEKQSGPEVVYMDQARDALDKENYEQALKILEAGKKAFPQSHRLRAFLGDIYSQRGIHPLALEEYRKALELDPENYRYNFVTAETLGLLNRNQESIAAFELTLVKFPLDAQAVQALAWMYFKVEDFRRGVDLIEAAVQELGGNRSFSMTLGTLYSSLYEYEKSRKAYQESIRRALGEGDKEFAAIAYYNLSILETSFLKYQEAFRAVEDSLDQDRRASGYLALGELFQAQMNFRRALETFEKADQQETTPLTKMDMAKLYRQFGFLDQARAYLEEVESHKDNSWMYNFGVTQEKWQQDIHQTWGEIYQGYSKELNFRRRFWPWEWAQWLWDKVVLGLQSWYHEQLAKDLQYRIAGETLALSENPTGWWNLYKASDRYPFVARKYLARARDFEAARIPGVVPLYRLEEGKLEDKPELLAQALAELDPQWMGLERTEAILGLLPKVEPHERRQLLNQLYRINPGALRQAGWSLPLQVNLYGSSTADLERWKSELQWWTGTTGHDATFSGEEGRDYQLNLNLGSDGTVRYALKDKDGLSVFQDFGKAPDPQDFLNGVFARIHRVQ